MIIIVIKPWRLCWDGHVGHREIKKAYKIAVTLPKERGPLGGPRHSIGANN
jgi:hypothetical protein